MSFAVRKAHFTAITAGSTQTVSPDDGDPGLGAAKAVLFFGVALNADDTVGAHDRFFMGAACPDGTDGCTTFAADDNVGTMIGGGRTEMDAALKIDLQATTPTLDAQATVTTWNSDGSIVVNWSNLPSLGFRIHALLFYGDEITNATVRQVTTPAAAGSHSHTGMAFKPTFVFRPTSAQTSLGVRANGAHHSWSMFTAEQSLAGGFAVSEAAQSANAIAQRAGRSFYAPSTAGALLWDAYLVSMNSDGWTEQFVTSGGSSNAWALCLAGTFKVALGTDTKPTTATSKSTVARTAPDTTQSPTFSDTFAYSDGALSTVSGGAWGNPLLPGQGQANVSSGKLTGASAGWSDGYSAGSSYGNGDYVASGLTAPAAGNEILLHACAAHTGEGGADSYAIHVVQGSSIRVRKVVNDTYTDLSTAPQTSIATGDALCLRIDSGWISGWWYDSTNSVWKCVCPPVRDTTYTSGRIGFELEGTSPQIDRIDLYPLPAGFPVSGALLYSRGQTAATTVDSTGAECGKVTLGAFDDQGFEGTVWFAHDDDQTTAEANMRTRNTKALLFTSDYTGTVDAEADATATSVGFDLNWTTADAVETEFQYAAFGSAASAVKQVAAVIAGASTVAAVVARRRAVAAVVAGASSVTAAVTRKKPAAPLVSAVSTVTANVVRKRTVAALVSGVSTVTAAPTRKVSAQPLVAGASSVSAAVSRRRAVAAGVGALSSVTAAAGARRLAQATVAGVSTVTAVARRANKYVTPLVAASSSVVATPSRRRAVAATVSGVSTVTAAAGARRHVAATVAASSSVTAAVSRRRAIAAGIAAVSTVQALPTRPRRVQAVVAGASSVTASAGARRAVSPGVFASSSVTVAGTTRLRRVAADVAATSSVEATPATPVTILPTVAIGYYV